MKIIVSLFLITSLMSSLLGQTLSDIENETNSFLDKYVSNNRVNYSAIKTSPEELNRIVLKIGSVNLSGANDYQKKAFYINSYNLLVIQQVIKNFPVKSVMDISGFFDKTVFLVSGEKLTLNELENKKLRDKYNDPRFHFVLVCGAVSCPPIINESYKEKSIDQQLENQTISAINDPMYIRIDGNEVEISEIFNWYKGDFTSNGKSLNSFINKYRTSKISNDIKLKYYAYDWSLNEVENHTDNEVAPDNTSINLQTYNPGSLLKKGQMDITLFSSIYTENENNWVGQTYTGYRTTFASTVLKYTYGLTRSARFTVGVDISLRGSGKSNNDDSYSNISRAFDFENNDSTRFGVSYISPNIKFQPFKDVDEFTLQSSFQITIPNKAEGYSNPDGSGDGNLFWIEWDRYIWWTQFYYSKLFLQDKFQVFAEADLLFRFAKSPNQITHYDMPVSLFLSWFPTNKFTIYGMVQHVPRFIFDTKNPKKNDWVIGADYTQFGGGMKYQMAKSIQLELLYTNFFRATNNGLGETFNLGIKYILQ